MEPQTLQNFLATEITQSSVWEFLLNLIIAAFLSLTLSKFYTKYGKSLSNRKVFSENFVLISLTTLLIISIVQGSLALSLGLIGALSIVRFRAAIKDPEELAYLFISIAIGLGLGANQRLITVIAFFFIMLIIMLKNSKRKTESDQNLFLSISSKPEDFNLEEIVNIIKKNTRLFQLKRFDKNENLIEAAFMIEFDDILKVQSIDEEFRKAANKVKVSFIDNKGIY